VISNDQALKKWYALTICIAVVVFIFSHTKSEVTSNENRYVIDRFWGSEVDAFLNDPEIKDLSASGMGYYTIEGQKRYALLAEQFKQEYPGKFNFRYRYYEIGGLTVERTILHVALIYLVWFIFVAILADRRSQRYKVETQSLYSTSYQPLVNDSILYSNLLVIPTVFAAALYWDFTYLCTDVCFFPPTTGIVAPIVSFLYLIFTITKYVFKNRSCASKKDIGFHVFKFLLIHIMLIAFAFFYLDGWL
jgi:hypothetical protein